MIVQNNPYLNLIQLRAPNCEFNSRFVYPQRDRSFDARYRAESFTALTRNYRSLTQKFDPRQTTNQSTLIPSPKQQNKFFSQNNSPNQPNQNLLLWQQQSLQIPQSQTTMQLNLSNLDLRSQITRLLDLNAKLITQQDTLESQLKSTKHKLNQCSQKHIRSQSRIVDSPDRVQQLEEEILKLKESLQVLQDNTEELVNEHNREIADLKCNMKNSIFEEDIQERPQVQQQTEIQYSFAQQPISQVNKFSDDLLTNSLSQVQFQVNLLREENELYRKQLNSIENQDEDLINLIQQWNQQLLNLYDTKFSQKITTLEEENQILNKQIDSTQLNENLQLEEVLSKFDDFDDQLKEGRKYKQQNNSFTQLTRITRNGT